MKKKILLFLVAILSLALLLTSCKIDSDGDITSSPNGELDNEPPKQFDEVVFVEKIELLNTDIKTNDAGEQYVLISPDDQGVRQYQIEYKVYPENATTKEVTFSCDSSFGTATVSETGLVVFEKIGAMNVYISPRDGSDIQTKLIVMAR